MGKLHSKLSSKCRQNPEGGVLVSNLLNSQREVELIPSNKETMSMNMHRDVQTNNCLLKVTLPPVQALDKSKHSNNEHIHSAVRNQGRNPFTDDPKQEWLFTTESGNSNKGDMSNFLHGVCKAIDASVKPATDSATTLKIKIVLSSSDDQHKVKKQETGGPMRRLYCVGENIERRNHYLDLAGIENFTSKFDDEESTHHKRSSHHHHLVATSDNCMQKECQSFSTHNSQRTRPGWKEEKSSRLDVHHPASLCRHHSSSFKHVTNGSFHRSHSKRLRPHTHASPRRPMCCHNQGGKDFDTLTTQPCSCSPLVRHDHHHLHEHHHHHHHHHAA